MTTRPVAVRVSQATRLVGSSVEAGVEDGVGNLVGDLIGMAFGDGFRSEKITVLGCQVVFLLHCTFRLRLRAVIARLALMKPREFESSGTCDDVRGAGETPTRQPA